MTGKAQWKYKKNLVEIVHVNMQLNAQPDIAINQDLFKENAWNFRTNNKELHYLGISIH